MPPDQHYLWSMVVTNTPGSLALGSALRRAREEVFDGKERRGSLRRLAAQLGIQHTTLSQWETGKRIPKPEDVARVLTALNVTGERYQRVMDIARHARDPNWLTVGIPGVSSALAGVMECERICMSMTYWSPMLISGLLQTGDYARALMAGSGPPSEISTRVTLRMGRRETLTRKNAPTFLALIGEQALRQNIGGPEVMANQLRFALKCAEQANVTVQVVPIGNGLHDGLSGPFELYQFADMPPMVLLEHYRSSLFLSHDSGTDDVMAFVGAAENIRQAALSVEDSATLIIEVAQELEKTL